MARLWAAAGGWGFVAFAFTGKQGVQLGLVQSAGELRVVAKLLVHGGALDPVDGGRKDNAVG